MSQLPPPPALSPIKVGPVTIAEPGDLRIDKVVPTYEYTLGGPVLRDSFDITPEYLSEDRGGADVEYDFFRYGQLGTRRGMALKVWAALKSLGVRGYAEVAARFALVTLAIAINLAHHCRRAFFVLVDAQGVPTIVTRSGETPSRISSRATGPGLARITYEVPGVTSL